MREGESNGGEGNRGEGREGGGSEEEEENELFTII